MKKKLTETLKQNDLELVVSDRIHVDEYKSKMGNDEDIVVLSFKTMNKEPGMDLVDFIEKGFEFVLDADVSSGELGEGDYLVFVELERTPGVIDQIIKIVDELQNLTGIKLSEYKVSYGKSVKKYPLKKDVLEQLIPLTAEAYLQQFPPKDDMDPVRTAAGIPEKTTAPINDWTEGLRVAGGIK